MPRDHIEFPDGQFSLRAVLEHQEAPLTPCTESFRDGNYLDRELINRVSQSDLGNPDGPVLPREAMSRFSEIYWREDGSFSAVMDLEHYRLEGDEVDPSIILDDMWQGVGLHTSFKSKRDRGGRGRALQCEGFEMKRPVSKQETTHLIFNWEPDGKRAYNCTLSLPCGEVVAEGHKLVAMIFPQGKIDVLREAQDGITEIEKGERTDDQTFEIPSFGDPDEYSGYEELVKDRGSNTFASRKTVSPKDWYFYDHFKDDPVMPGCFGVSGGWQLMQQVVSDKIKTPVEDLEVVGNGSINFLGQIFAREAGSQIRYELSDLVADEDESTWTANLTVQLFKGEAPDEPLLTNDDGSPQNIYEIQGLTIRKRAPEADEVLGAAVSDISDQVGPAIHTGKNDPVVIIGSGSLNALGDTPQNSYQAALDGKTGIRRLTRDDIPDFEGLCAAKGIVDESDKEAFFANVWGEKCGAGAMIDPEWIGEVGDYPKSFSKAGKFIVGVPVLQAYKVSQQLQAALPGLFSDEGRVRADLAPETMIDMGNGAGSSVEMMEKSLAAFIAAENTPSLGNEYGVTKWLIGMLGNMISGHQASQLGVAGAQNSSNSACSSSGLSAFNGFNAIKADNALVSIAGGSEYSAGPVATYVSFDHIMKRRGGALARKWQASGEIERALMAFDPERSGFIPGNAASMIVMTKLSVAEKLGLKPTAEVLSMVANTCQSERFDLAMSNGTIIGQSALIDRAFEKAGLSASDLPGNLVHYLHGTGTAVGGANEVYAAALNQHVSGLARDGRYLATGVKEGIGHTLGAAFTDNVVAALAALQGGRVPHLPNTRSIDEKLSQIDPKVIGKQPIELDAANLQAICDGIVLDTPRDIDAANDVVWIDSKGFGGTNAGMLVRAVR